MFNRIGMRRSKDTAPPDDGVKPRKYRFSLDDPDGFLSDKIQKRVVSPRPNKPPAKGLDEDSSSVSVSVSEDMTAPPGMKMQQRGSVFMLASAGGGGGATVVLGSGTAIDTMIRVRPRRC